VPVPVPIIPADAIIASAPLTYRSSTRQAQRLQLPCIFACAACPTSDSPRTLADEYIIDYGAEYVQEGPNSLTFRFQMNSSWPYNDYLNNPFVPGGARVVFPQRAASASFCTAVQTAPGLNPGSIFAIYSTSGEPVNRATDQWDELDIELLGKQPGYMWVNWFHNGEVITADGVDNGRNVSMPVVANDGFHTYCLDWTIGDAAVWTIDGEFFDSLSLAGWCASRSRPTCMRCEPVLAPGQSRLPTPRRIKPMYVSLSYWGYNADWAGAIEPRDGSNLYDIFTEVKDWVYAIRA